MTNYSHLTDEELIGQLSLRDDLTDLEFELLDRFIRAFDSLAGYQVDHKTSSDNLNFGLHD